MRSLGLKIALPSYVPTNFHADKVIVSAGRENVDSLRYLIVYQNLSADKCFAIESVSGGIGDLPAGSRSYPLNSPIFGKRLVGAFQMRKFFIGLSRLLCSNTV